MEETTYRENEMKIYFSFHTKNVMSPSAKYFSATKTDEKNAQSVTCILLAADVLVTIIRCFFNKTSLDQA